MSCISSSLNSIFNFNSTQAQPQKETGGDHTLYFDFCTMHYWSLTTPKLIETYMQNLVSQFSDAGITDISLAFAQLNNIDELLNPNANPSATEDLFGYILKNYSEVLPGLVKAAHDEGLKVHLSFGGQNASQANVQICMGNQTPQGQASKFIQFLNQYQLDGMNFDIEGASANLFVSENEKTLLPFIQSLHQGLQAANKRLTLTTEASHGVLTTLKSLFFNQNNQPIFASLFDGLYLMTYDSGERYYIDANDNEGPANQVDWGLQTWIDAVTKGNACYIHTGFQDATAYEKPSSSAGKVYTITTQDRGAAAAQIMQQVKQTLSQNQYPQSLGGGFWWPDEGAMSSRYEIKPDGTSDFQMSTIKSYYKNAQPSFFQRIARAVGL